MGAGQANRSAGARRGSALIIAIPLVGTVLLLIGLVAANLTSPATGALERKGDVAAAQAAPKLVMVTPTLVVPAVVESPRKEASATAITASPNAAPTAAATATAAPPSPTAVASPTPPVIATTTRTAPPPVPTLAARPAPAPEGEPFVIGYSLQERPIKAVRLGSGPIRLAIMGSIHGGWERNTEQLVLALLDHFRAQRASLPVTVSLYFITTTNPDGLAAGSGREAAWNGRGVDLNRNFDTPNWSPDSYGRPGGRYGPTGVRKGAGGSAPFSEPETRAIRDFVQGQALTAVLSYHSGILSVTAKDGGGGIGEPLAKKVAAITGYPYVAQWTEYEVTGQFMDWLDGIGVQGVEIDLPDQQTNDFAKNLRAVEAVLSMLMNR